MAHGSANKGS